MSGLAVIIPTVPARIHYLNRTAGAYALTSPARLYVEYGWPTCGEGWNAGAAKALRDGCDVLHFGADDLIPEWGWWSEQVRALVERGSFPGAVLLNEDGTVWNPHEAEPGTLLAFPRVPIMSRATWERLGPVPPIHYYSDIWFGRQGDPTITVAEYRFIHLWAQENRRHDSEPDRLIYEEWLAKS